MRHTLQQRAALRLVRPGDTPPPRDRGDSGMQMLAGAILLLAIAGIGLCLYLLAEAARIAGAL